MRVILSVAMSADGYIDSADSRRLKLSGAEDFYDVHVLRAECDAILVGAETIRKDNPSLVTKHDALLRRRREKALADDPIKVTLTRGGDLPYDADFFVKGSGEKWVFCGGDISAMRDVPENVKFFDLPDDLSGLLAVLESRSVGVLLVEGGMDILTQFLRGGLAHHLRLAVAPFFVGGGGAPRFVGEGLFPHDAGHRMNLLSVRQLGDVAVLDYDLGGD